MLSDPSISKNVWSVLVKIRDQIKKLKGTLTQVRLIDASFIWTEPHSRRIKIKLVVQKEIQEGAILEQTVPVSHPTWRPWHFGPGARTNISDRVCRSRSSVYRLSKSWSKRLLEVCCSGSPAGQAQANIFIRRTSYSETWFVLLSFSRPPIHPIPTRPNSTPKPTPKFGVQISNIFQECSRILSALVRLNMD